MIRRVMGSTMVLAAALLAGESAHAAPTVALHVPVLAKMGRSNNDTVKFHLRNDSREPIVVKAGDQQMTLQPGKPVDVKLKVGETVTIAQATATFKEGELLATVSPDLKDATIALR